MRQDKVLWFAIVFSTFIYGGIAYMLHPQYEGSFDDAVKRQTTLVLYGMAFMSFIAGLVLPSTMRAPVRTKMIVALAIFESCALFGLIAAFLAQDWRLFIPTWIVALLGMWRVFPPDRGELRTSSYE